MNDKTDDHIDDTNDMKANNISSVEEVRSSSSEDVTATSSTKSSSSPKAKNHNKQGLFGLALVAVGLLAVLTNVGDDDAAFLWTGAISAALFFGYYRSKAYGLLIPACILAGVTAGIIFELVSPVEGVFLLGLGGGFVAIDRIAQEKSRWPLYPGIILMAIGTVITVQTLFNNMLFAIMLIVVGAYLLLRNRQVLDSMVDVKADIDIRVGKKDSQENAKEDSSAEATKTFASDASDEVANNNVEANATEEVVKEPVEEVVKEPVKASKAKAVEVKDTDTPNTPNTVEIIELDGKSVDSSVDSNVKDLDDAVSNIKKAVDKIVEDANLPKDSGNA